MLKKFFTAATVIEQACTIALLRKLVSVYEHRVRVLTADVGVLRATNELQKEKIRDTAGEMDRTRKSQAAMLKAARAAGIKLELVAADIATDELAANLATFIREHAGTPPVTETAPRVASWDPPAAPASRESKL